MNKHFTFICLQDYLPASIDRRSSILEKKRKQYRDLNDQFFNLRNGHDGAEIFKQVQKDLLRMPMLQNQRDLFGVRDCNICSLLNCLSDFSYLCFVLLVVRKGTV